VLFICGGLAEFMSGFVAVVDFFVIAYPATHR
jgi:hypothetical protein